MLYKGGKETSRTMRAGFVQEVAEVEQGVSRCQELQESLQERTSTQGLVLHQALKNGLGKNILNWHS